MFNTTLKEKDKKETQYERYERLLVENMQMLSITSNDIEDVMVFYANGKTENSTLETINEEKKESFKEAYDKLKGEIEKASDKAVTDGDFAKILAWWGAAMVLTAKIFPVGIALLVMISPLLVKVIMSKKHVKDKKEIKELKESLKNIKTLEAKANNPELKEKLSKIEADLSKAIKEEES